MGRPRKNKKSQHELAAQWGTSQVNIGKLTAAGCDFDASDKEVAEWLNKNCKRKSPAMRAAIKAVLQPTKIKISEVEGKRSLEEMRDYYGEQLDATTKSDSVDREDVKFWNDLLLKADESLRRSEAHAKKLGVDKGELLSRGEVERIMRAMFWAGNACCEKFAKQIAQKLSNKEPAEIYDILAPLLTSLTLFEALKKVAKPPGEVNLPDWFVDCAATEETQYIEHE
jgi:hypothetical protein